MLKVPKTFREITSHWLVKVRLSYCQQFDGVSEGELSALRIVVLRNALQAALHRRTRYSNASSMIESLSLLEKLTDCLLSEIPPSERYRACHRLDLVMNNELAQAATVSDAGVDSALIAPSRDLIL